MATYTSDLTANVLTACDAVSGWTELPSPHSSGGSPASDTENYFHNSNSVSQSTGQASGQAAGCQYDNGSGVTWTTSSNWCFFVWTYYAAPTNLLSWSSGGFRVGIGSADNNAYLYNVGGSDFGLYPYGGWQNSAFDPEYATPDQTIGSPGATYQNFAILPNVTAKITKGSPIAIDVIRYGRGEIKAIGTSSTFTGMATFNDNATTGRYGLFAAQAGSYLWKGLMSLGDASNSVTFSDSNKLIRIDDTPRVISGFNAIEINHASSSVTWTSITINGVETSITGSAPISAGSFEVVDNATVSLNSCTFVDMDTFIFNDGTNSNTITDSTFRRCGLITTGGATFTGCTFDTPEGTVGVTTSSPANAAKISGSTFNSDGTGNGLEITGTAANMTLTNVDFSGYSTTVDADKAIYVNIATGTMTITISGGSGVTLSSHVRTAGATVNVVSGSVTTQVHVINTAGDDIENARVILKASDGTGPFPYKDAITSITRSGPTATVTTTAVHGMATNDYASIKGCTNNENFNGVKQITVTDTDEFTFTVPDSGTTSGTGTMVVTFVALYGLSNSAGIVTADRVYSSDQPIQGWARKSSATPYYKQSPLTGSVDSGTGYNATALMVLDE